MDWRNLALANALKKAGLNSATATIVANQISQQQKKKGGKKK